MKIDEIKEKYPDKVGHVIGSFTVHKLLDELNEDYQIILDEIAEHRKDELEAKDREIQELINKNIVANNHSNILKQQLQEAKDAINTEPRPCVTCGLLDKELQAQAKLKPLPKEVIPKLLEMIEYYHEMGGSIAKETLVSFINHIFDNFGTPQEGEF